VQQCLGKQLMKAVSADVSWKAANEGS
jgi:hypothetical protein